MAFVEFSQQSPSESRTSSPQAAPPERPAESSATSAPAEPNIAPAAPQAETESRKKFTKSYGA
jgi:hypothetical protein